MNKKEIRNYYFQEEILKRITSASRNREISFMYENGNYSSRPNVIQYIRDVKEIVRKGGVSFHGSVERWENPMRISTNLSKEELNELRKGWDLVIDIDSSIGLESAKLTALKVIECLKKNGIKNYGLKFSGNRGFHLSVGWEAFPKKVDFEKTRLLYPKIPRLITSYIRKEIKEELFEDLRKQKGSISGLIEDLEGNIEKLTPFAFVDVEKDWGQRHLFRIPYSLNEKSWLVSLPLKKKELEDFDKEDAKPGKIKTKENFFKPVEPGEATDLTLNALDWYGKKSEVKESERESEKRKIRSKRKIPVKRFPPCIKTILKGLSDGKKRSVFILYNFLKTLNWKPEEIEEKIREWNKQNNPPLEENYIRTQLKWFERQSRELLPPNCDNATFYKSFGVCKPDEKCKQGTNEIKIKNPVVYPFKK